MSLDRLGFSGCQKSVDVKYESRPSYGHESDNDSVSRDCNNDCFNQFRASLKSSFELPWLHGFQPESRIFGFVGSRVGRRYWSYCRSLPFFRREDAERARQPHLEITGSDLQGKHIRVAVVNTGGSEARRCYGRITIDHDIKDVIDAAADGIHTFITNKDYSQLKEMGLCWACAGNPSKVDIPVGGVAEMLEIAKLDETVGHRSEMHFHIPSEEGWDGYGKGELRKSRVLLRARTYEGKLIVGAGDIAPIERGIALVYVESEKRAFLEIRATA